MTQKHPPRPRRKKKVRRGAPLPLHPTLLPRSNKIKVTKAKELHIQSASPIYRSLLSIRSHPPPSLSSLFSSFQSTASDKQQRIHNKFIRPPLCRSPLLRLATPIFLNLTLFLFLFLFFSLFTRHPAHLSSSSPSPAPPPSLRWPFPYRILPQRSTHSPIYITSLGTLPTLAALCIIHSATHPITVNSLWVA